MRHKLAPKTTFRSWEKSFSITNASKHNLKNIQLEIPQGVLVCITGVAGSGKSTLMHHEFLQRYPNAVVIDQSPVGKSIRSTPATYTGVFDHIRRLFAIANPGTSDSFFSFNAEGACQLCNGLGEIETDLAFMDPIRTPCEACGGVRYKKEVLKYRYQGKTIVEVLTLTINDSLIFFTDTHLHKKLTILQEVGLGYLELGQPLSTLSGGECQRIKLASELHKEGRVYVLDEPTTGLHMSDIKTIVDLLERLVMHGNSVLVIEHCIDVMNQADWIIDVGPEGGSSGGEIIFCGTPYELQKNSNGHTAKAMRSYNKTKTHL